ncbi:MAG: type II secretion system protein [Lachnospiraceae bacterium]|nr:type II secretion system protein [Lachnospiraceae bacterium]
MVSRELRLRTDNRGSTLIEIIVSVLIVGIVFVPLLMSLNVALKANIKSESELYAETVATNCMEVVKAYGIQGLNDYIDHSPTAVGGIVDFPEAGSGAKLQKDTSLTNAFIISGIKEGTKVYTAKFSFDNTPYEPTIPEGGTTPIPAQNSLDGYSVISEISNGQALRVNLAENQDEENIKEIVKAAEAIPENITNYFEGKTDSERFAIAKSWIKKKTTFVKISKLPDTLPDTASAEDKKHAGQYKIEKQIIYNCLNSIPFEGATHNGGVFKVPETPSCEYRKSAVAPDAILLFYSVLNYSIDEVTDEEGNTTYKYNLNNINAGSPEEIIQIEKDIPEDMSFYTICKQISQKDFNADGSLKHSGKMKYHFKATTGAVKFYNQFNDIVPVEIDGSASAIPVSTNIIRDATNTDKIKKMYDLKIQVYDSDSELRSTKNSTMVDVITS